MASPELVFDYDAADEDIYVDTMKRHGAVIIKGYISSEATVAITEQILERPFTEIDEVHGKVHEQFGLQEWPLADAPSLTRAFVEHAGMMVREQGIPWLPTAIRAQLYRPKTSGVDWHRDFKPSLLTVGVLNLIGEALFDVRVDGSEVRTLLEPGDFALLRNTGINPGVDDRVEHRVHAPIVVERLSLGIRQEGIAA